MARSPDKLRNTLRGCASGLLRGDGLRYTTGGNSFWRIHVEQLRQRLFENALADLDRRYDGSAQMVKVPVRSAGYHTTLTGGMVHPYRDSATYALALLDAERDDLLPRAEAVLDAVLAGQDDDPDHDTYGIWPYFSEESLDQMSPPDWNWADFIGKLLLAVVVRHGDRLAADLRARVDESIRHAAISIRRRDVGPDYTNIAIMGTYVTHLYAEHYGDTDMLSYATGRLRRIVDYTTEHGAFTEYNSPTYNLLFTLDLARMLADITSPDSLALANRLYDLAWKNIAVHFHPATQQWAGPHGRSYVDLRDAEFYTILYIATDGNVEIIDTPNMALRTEIFRVPVRCPEKYWRVIMDPAERQLREQIVKGDPDRLATTYLASSYTLGTFYKSHFWNQSRPLIAYWDNDGDPSYLRAQFLHNGHDFSSALSLVVQEKARALGAVCFCDDNGDTHPSLDPLKDGALDAEDLRLRFIVGGKRDNVTVETVGRDAITFSDGTRTIAIRLLHAAFDGEAVHRIETGGDADCDWADVVLLHGRKKHFRVSNLDECIVGYALNVDSDGADSLRKATAASRAGERLELSYCDDSVSMQLSIPTLPAPKAKVFAASEGTIAGTPFGE